MIEIKFTYKGARRQQFALLNVIDGFAGHLGMIGGGGSDLRTGEHELIYEAHNDCDCGAPIKKRISPKMRDGLVRFVKSKVKGRVTVGTVRL